MSWKVQLTKPEKAHAAETTKRKTLSEIKANLVSQAGHPQPGDGREVGGDLDAVLRHAETAAGLPDMSAIWPEVFQRPKEGIPDVDEDLYGGFINNDDRRRLNQLRALPPAELAHSRTGFDDERLEELVFRDRARNFEATLSDTA